MNNPSENGMAPAIEAKEVWFAYRRGQTALQGISLTIEPGILCMLLGPSGSGKSTFLRAVKGLLKPERGEVRVFGRPVANGSRSGAAGRQSSSVAYIPQNLGLVRNLTVLENALTGALGRTPLLRSLLKLFSGEQREEALSILERLGIRHKADEKVHDLSGGERQRVAIARALLQRPRLVLADEFVSQLDPVTTAEIMEAVAGIAREGVTFLITSHQVPLVERYGDRAVFFRNGQKVYECPGGEVSMDAVRRLMAD